MIFPYECEITHANFGGDWTTFVKVMAKKLMHPSSRTRDWLPSVRILRGLCYMHTWTLFKRVVLFRSIQFCIHSITNQVCCPLTRPKCIQTDTRDDVMSPTDTVTALAGRRDRQRRLRVSSGHHRGDGRCDGGTCQGESSEVDLDEDNQQADQEEEE